MSVSDTRLAQITERLAELEARLGSGTLEGAAFVTASRDYAELEPVARAAAQVRAMRGELAELSASTDPDPEMRALADEEIARIKRELPEAEHALAVAMLPRDSADGRPIQVADPQPQISLGRAPAAGGNSSPDGRLCADGD